MLLQRYVVGPISTNLYVVACKETFDGMVIDPGFEDKEGDRILQRILQLGAKIRFIVNTHGHADHIGGNRLLKNSTGGEILFHDKDSEMITRPGVYFSKNLKLAKMPPSCPSCGRSRVDVEIDGEKGRAILTCSTCGFTLEGLASPPADRLLHGGETIEVGALRFEVIHTPGHSPGGISLYSPNEKTVFTGDTLFKGSIGRTDILWASHQQIMKSLDRLMGLPDGTIVYPGHGEKTTIGIERRTNPYIPKMNPP